MLSMLSVSTPRSRLGSEILFEDMESIIQSSKVPPVGTTRPPLYPKVASRCAPRNREVSDKAQNSCPKRAVKRLVNKPMKPPRAGERA